jgi:ribonucleotide reductase alpha subunit
MMQLSKNALTVLEKRYLKKADGEVVETPEDMLHRVAGQYCGCGKDSLRKKR